MKAMKGNILLLITAIVWGCAFVAQSMAMDSVEPFTFQATRNFLGAIVLLPLIFISNFKNKKNKSIKKNNKSLLIGGTVCGLVLFVASTFQQYGLKSTSPGNGGFITAMYILIVPVLGLFVKKKVSFRMWVCIAVAITGMFFLCFKDNSMVVGKGDILVMLCAVVFSFHILAVDKYASFLDGIKLSCLQFFVCSFASFIMMLIFDSPSVSAIKSALPMILYAGIGSCGIGYTLQVVGQKYTKPVVASLIMSLESVFAVIAQIVIMGTLPSPREALGCLLMFGAIIVSQVPEKSKSENLKI